ncbi:BadF/BadG/BcrA/BcrD ATPase family protein [uncultured Clostridium sp.]|uniref:BadF/BadG/BcrA/BcrD ATPase family protein n=1 Tax=uncultured Clostridium sp. TaxID=59620 RepID=UPI0028E83B12|nr:BadF/BadG/BcrA/BcrD ATPase family protein [uncultured Clostridium sp.]
MRNKVFLPVLSIDGGGTKCLSALLDYESNIAGVGESGSCNYQSIGEEKSKESIKKSILNAMEHYEKKYSCKVSKIECVIAGIAGNDTGKDKKVMERIFKSIFDELNITVDKYILENDAYITLNGALEDREGVLIISGTGSICYGKNNENQYYRTGGWGYIVGDEGSGFWIGSQAIKFIFHSEDGRKESTLLRENILNSLKLENIEELMGWVYSEDYSIKKVSALAKDVFNSASHGDELALKIVNMAAEELLSHLNVVVDKLHLKEDFTLVLLGGLLENNTSLKDILVKKVMENYNKCNIVHMDVKPIFGAMILGLKHSNLLNPLNMQKVKEQVVIL